MTASPPPLHRFESADAAGARLAKLDLADAARPLAAASGGDLVAAAHALRTAGMTTDAVSVLAQALNRRAAVWWACVAAHQEPQPGLSEHASAESPDGSPRMTAAELAALAAAEAWVREPSETAAHAAFAAAETAGAGSPAACAALAAFFASDSIAPPSGTRVPPPEHVAGLVSAGAIQLSAVRHRPDLAGQTMAALLDRGFAIATGREHWTTPGPTLR
jgi:hypothetical protein